MSRPPHGLPRWVRLLIRLTTPRHHREALEDDLAQDLRRVRKSQGRTGVARFLFRELLGAARHGLRDRLGSDSALASPSRSRAPAGGREPRLGAPPRRYRTMMDHLRNDLRSSARALAKKPGFTVAAAVTLALGIGPTTAIFSVVTSVLLSPLPYDAPERLVQVWNGWSNRPGARRGRSPMSPGDFADLHEIDSFESVAAYSPPSGANLTGGDEPERVLVTRATASIFDVLGSEPVLGRTYSVEEDAPDRGDVVVLSHRLWARLFGSDPSVLEGVIRLDGLAHRIVGVMPPGFRLPGDYLAEGATEVWKPLGLDPADTDRGNQWLYALARLTSGSRLAVTNTQLEALTRRWIDQGFKIRDHPPFYAEGIEDQLFGSVRPVLFLILGAVGFVLLVACVNVANLLLARADGRRAEMAVRRALGATRARVTAQLLSESVLLAVAGGGVGLVLAYLGVQALLALEPASIPRVDEVRIDGMVLGFSTLLTLATAFLFGLAPAARISDPDLATRLASDGRSTTSGRGEQRFRGGLVTAEVALAVLLTIGATLMIRTVVALGRIDLGFAPDGVLTFRVSLPGMDYPEPGDRSRLFGELLEGLAGLPGARSSGAATVLPLTTPLDGGSVEIEGAERPRPGEGWPNARWQIVTPGYFETMGYSLVAGRLLDPDGVDRSADAPVVVVNRTLAEMFWPDRDPVGRRLRSPGSDRPWLTVVGVVGDVRHSSPVARPSPTMYLPLEQVTATTGYAPASMAVVIGAVTSPESLAGAARRTVRSLDPNLPVAEVRAMSQVVDDALARSRFTTLLLTVFAGVGLTLAVVGIHGVLSDNVSRRRQEMGIRVALGSPRRAVLGLVVWKGFRFALVGIPVGLLVGFLLTRFMTSVLYGVRPLDTTTFLLVPSLCTVVALAASYLPARRATRVDPVVALREEIS